MDGIDYFIWESLREFQPKLVVIEFNPTIPNDVMFIQAKDSSIKQGCSLLALTHLAAAKGYKLVCCTVCNAFFVRQEFFNQLGIPSDFIYYLYRPVLDGRIFQGQDSTIYVTGMEKLLWLNIPLSSDDFQVIPSSMRRFPDTKE